VHGHVRGTGLEVWKEMEREKKVECQMEMIRSVKRNGKREVKRDREDDFVPRTVTCIPALWKTRFTTWLSESMNAVSMPVYLTLGP
jgi:hypothetical protein